MFNPFKRNRKAVDIPENPDFDQANEILDTAAEVPVPKFRRFVPAVPGQTIPVHLKIPIDEFRTGVQVHIDEEEIRFVPNMNKVFERMYRIIAIEYKPDRGFNNFPTPWTIRVEVPFMYRSQTIGKGAELVKEIGLEFPNPAVPDVSRVAIDNDGKFYWSTRYLPEADQIETVVKEIERQVQEIIRDYIRLRNMRRFAKD